MIIEMPYRELQNIMRAAEELIPKNQLESMTVEISTNEQNNPKLSLKAE